MHRKKRHGTEFGLTSAELEIAVGIADGRTLAELAETRRVSIHTVRNQLKSAMWKMNVRRQVDLVRVITVARDRPGVRQHY